MGKVIVGIFVTSLAAIFGGILLQERQEEKKRSAEWDEYLKKVLSREVNVDEHIAAVKSWKEAYNKYQAGDVNFGETGLGLKPGLTFPQFVEKLGYKKEKEKGDRHG